MFDQTATDKPTAGKITILMINVDEGTEERQPVGK